jgi:uncharacterized protein (TIGR00255 family)
MERAMKKINSMTGFATGHAEYNNAEISCEIRSLNSRYLEVSLRVPRILSDLENQIKDIIRQKITRGKVMYSLNFSSLNSELQNLKIEPDTIKIYAKLLKQMKKEAKIREEIKLDHLLAFKDIISFEEETEVNQKLSNFIFKLSNQTLDKLTKMRANEGNFLKTDLKERLQNIVKITSQISNLGKKNARHEFDKLYQRVLALIDENKIENHRFEQELAILADKVDITEEAVRLKSHIKLFEDNLKSGSPVGKKLNFILQEMNRETNTISNKTTMVEISHQVVRLKEEIEKVREQVQNIE